MTPKSAFDATIPVLTEVFQDQPVKAASPQALEPEWELLERRLSERILDQLQGQVEVALQNAMAGLTDEIRRSLQHTVAGAVAQELRHLQTLKK